MDHVLLSGLEPCSVYHSDHLSEVRGLKSEIGRHLIEDSLAYAVHGHRLGHLLTVRHLQSREHRVQGYLERVSLVDPDVLLLHLVPNWSHSVNGFLRASCRMHKAAGGMTSSH